jgi:hypothetical protein
MQTSFQPWLDFEHRRYWIAEKDADIVAVLVLTRIQHKQYQIKNAVSFPNAPRGSSETIIYSVMSDLQDEGVTPDDSDRKSEDGALLWTQTDIEVARKLQENSGPSRSQSVDSRGSDSSLVLGEFVRQVIALRVAAPAVSRSRLASRRRTRSHPSTT